MTMNFWIIVSWVVVALLTIGNIFFFLKLKKASEQMMKMAFPNAKNMNDALSQMQGMMGQFQGMSGAKKGNPFAGKGGGNKKDMDAQLKKAMELLQKR